MAFFLTMSVRRLLNLRNAFIINKFTSDQAFKVVSFKFYHLFISRVFYGNYRFGPDSTPH